jgi:hypothetical protein
MNIRTCFLLLLLFLIRTSTSVAATIWTNIWTPSAGDNWNRAANWNTGRVPNNDADNIYDVLIVGNSGTVATLTNSVTIRNLTFNRNGAFLQGYGDIHVTGDLDWEAGTISTTVAADGLATIHRANPLFMDFNGKIVARGTMTLDSELTMNRAASLEVAPGGIFNILNGASITTRNPDGATIINRGEMDVFPGAMPFSITGPYIQNYGTLIVERPLTNNSSMRQFQGALEMRGGSLGAVQVEKTLQEVATEFK